MIKKYAIVSTNYYYNGEWRGFHLVKTGLTEEDLLKMKFFYDEYIRLWNECYSQERENAINNINKDIRSELNSFLKKNVSEDDHNSIEDYYQIWQEKDLIIEHYEV